MAASRPKLDTVRVQTARMLEIYSLLRAEMERGDMRLSSAECDRLNGAIRTIAGNMARLQAEFVDAGSEAATEAPSDTAPVPEPSSAPSIDARDIDEIVDAVLKWQSEGQGE